MEAKTLSMPVVLRIGPGYEQATCAAWGFQDRLISSGPRW